MGKIHGNKNFLKEAQRVLAFMCKVKIADVCAIDAG
jgi:hypothetical protein